MADPGRVSSLVAGLRARFGTAGLTQRTIAAERDRGALLDSARTLLGTLRELTADLGDAGAAAVKRQIAELHDEVGASAERPETVHRLSERLAAHGAAWLDFGRRARAYLGEREAELLQIIEVLSAGLGEVGTEGADDNRKLIEQTARLERLTQVDDLRRLRSELGREVGILRETVRERQRREAERVERLQAKVVSLQQDVATARQEAMTDPLTGAANRAAFDGTMAALCRGAASEGPGFALLLVDVDHFKTINDQHGHIVGDRVLRSLVVMLRQEVRETDLLARYGGEEFAIVLPGATGRSALKKARHLCRALEERRWSFDGDGLLRFTASIGVAAWREGDRASEVVARADAALYQAKHDGRNRACDRGRVARPALAAPT